ncbi:MAG: hypothetical protein D6814_11955 [Calditrichaeota bacterium]|nr:MAG: hypothetical protein D6814_11955 [Calditrichota bacterium]
MKARTTTLCLAAFLLLLSQTNAQAQLKGFAFLRTTVGARAAGMGNAYIAMKNDLHSIVANPAALAGISERRGTFDYVNHLLDIQSGFGAYLHPMASGNLAFSLFYQDYGKLDKLDEQGNEQGTFSANSFILTAAYARPSTEKLWLGAAIKYFRSNIEDFSADGFAVDLGVYLSTSIFDNLQIGAGVFNLGKARTAFITTKEDLPTRLEVGVSKRLAHLPLEWALSLQKYPDEDLRFAAGGEFTLSENLFFRLGYNSLGKDQKLGASSDRFAGISTGLGLSYEKYQFDYAYSSYGVVGSLSRFSVSIKF